MWIFTLVLMMSTTSQNRAMTSVVVEYTSQEACMAAAKFNASKLTGNLAEVVLMTCTKK